VLVTALTLDIGRHMWWPSALAHRENRPVTDGTVAPAHPQADSVIDGT
jgi:RND superfamily putative drug exporter